jgi:DNA-binding MarR family transcriptional regulator
MANNRNGLKKGILGFLRGNKSSAANQISASLGVERHNAMNALLRLRRNGLVSALRAPNGEHARRVFHYSLSKKGRKRLDFYESLESHNKLA